MHGLVHRYTASPYRTTFGTFKLFLYIIARILYQRYVTRVCDKEHPGTNANLIQMLLKKKIRKHTHTQIQQVNIYN